MSSGLQKLLQFLDRDDVSEVVLQTDAPPSAKLGGTFRPLSANKLTTAQIEGLVAGTPLEEELARGDGNRVVATDLLGRHVSVRVARRGPAVQLRFEHGKAPAHPVKASKKARASMAPPAAKRSHAAAAPKRASVAPPASRSVPHKKPRSLVPPAPRAVRDGHAPAGLAEVLTAARGKRASDVHVVAGRPVQVRTSGALLPEGDPLSAELVESWLLPILSAEHKARLDALGYADTSLDLGEGGRFRVNVSRQRGGLKGSFRLVMAPIPTLESLGLPPELAKVTTYHQGLVILAGPSGHGKTTTLAAIVDLVNSTKSHHVLTVEDPIEFVHPVKKALLSQREVGPHTRSFASALKASLREDPDVIVIGELRDKESVEIAITASETGHLVLATMNTPSGGKTIDRLIDMFPPGDQQQVRVTLAGALKFVVAQRLLPRASGDGFAAAVELITGTPPLWALIRDNKLFHLPNLLQRGRAFGMIRFDDSLYELVKSGVVDEAEALLVADGKKELAARLRGDKAPPPAEAQAPPPQGAQPAAAQKLGDLAARVGKGLFGRS